jgi:hypothetical protein
MTAGSAPHEATGSKPKALAFYLPQYHPIPENDEWWGKGFTEWTNVAKARPLYPGHYQPHVPGELGYYDLRVPEVREAQAALARSHGISGFVYYHYWFHGKRLLHRPFDEVLSSGSPDFPFALCWANEEWTRNWEGESGHVLMPQEYSAEDDVAHLRWLVAPFSDPRYIKIDGRPLVLIYRPGLLPDPRRTAERWRAEAQKAGFPDIYLCWVEGWGKPPGGPERFGFDATVGFVTQSRERIFTPVTTMRNHRIIDYVASYEKQLNNLTPNWKHFPSVMVGWDNTARHPQEATIYEGATPEQYRRWLEMAVESVKGVRSEENYLFLVAWNEWAEGNHLEPDLRFGRAFLEATRSVLATEEDQEHVARGSLAAESEAPRRPPASGRPGTLIGDSAASNVVELIALHSIDPKRRIVNLCVDDDAGQYPFASQMVVHHLVGDSESVRRLKVDGLEVSQCDFTDPEELEQSLNDLGQVGALLLAGVLQQIPEPHRLLVTLSEWARASGDVPLYVVIPNVAHRDVAMGLLLGEWNPARPGPLYGKNLHYLTGQSLERLVNSCGWALIDRLDARSVHSDSFDPEVAERLPEEMVGALEVVAETYNPYWAVEYFVWALAPGEIGPPPRTFVEAAGDPPGSVDSADPRAQRAAVQGYLDSVGLVASETSRRAVALGRAPRPAWKRAILRMVRSSPERSATFNKVRRRLG